jgi:hypothetical protein
VVTDAFLADGGDGYAIFRQAQDRIERQVPLRDLLLQALKASPLGVSTEHRIGFEETKVSAPPAP